MPCGGVAGAGSCGLHRPAPQQPVTVARAASAAPKIGSRRLGPAPRALRKSGGWAWDSLGKNLSELLVTRSVDDSTNTDAHAYMRS